MESLAACDAVLERPLHREQAFQGCKAQQISLFEPTTNLLPSTTSPLRSQPKPAACSPSALKRPHPPPPRVPRLPPQPPSRARAPPLHPPSPALAGSAPRAPVAARAAHDPRPHPVRPRQPWRAPLPAASAPALHRECLHRRPHPSRHPRPAAAPRAWADGQLSRIGARAGRRFAPARGAGAQGRRGAGVQGREERRGRCTQSSASGARSGCSALAALPTTETLRGPAGSGFRRSGQGRGGIRFI